MITLRGAVAYIPLYKHDWDAGDLTPASHVWEYHHFEGSKV